MNVALLPVDKFDDVLVEVWDEMVEVLRMGFGVQTFTTDPFHSVPESRDILE